MSAGGELSAFRKDLDRLAQEVEALTGSMKEDRRLAGEEAVGAELLVSRDLVAHLGLLWETAEQLGDLYLRQCRYWADDNAATLAELCGGASAGTGPGSGVAARHLERRLSHLGEGMGESARLLSRQSTRMTDSLIALWQPYLAVLKADWTKRRPPGAA